MNDVSPNCTVDYSSLEPRVCLIRFDSCAGDRRFGWVGNEFLDLVSAYSLHPRVPTPREEKECAKTDERGVQWHICARSQNQIHARVRNQEAR